MRLALVRSPAAKERLLSCVSSGNYEKVRTAPITAIVAYDREFFELLPRLYPHTDARGWFTTNAALAEETGLRNSSLQGAYFILALRAQGLDCGPMSGFDADKVDAVFAEQGFEGSTRHRYRPAKASHPARRSPQAGHAPQP